MPVEIEFNRKRKTTWIEPGMLIKTISDKMGDQRVALNIYCSPDDSSGYVELGLLQVETRYKLGPFPIGEKITVINSQRVDLIPNKKEVLRLNNGTITEIIALTLRKNK